MPYVISKRHDDAIMPAYWQTLWAMRACVMDEHRRPLIGDDGRKIYLFNEDGSHKYIQVGGWVGKLNWATMYNDHIDAERANAIMGLCGAVEYV